MTGWTYADYQRAHNLTAEQKAALRTRAKEIHQARCDLPDAIHHPAGAADYEQARAELAAEATETEATR